ncbi:olfactory receptor 6T1 [Trichechus inunguis]
MSPENWAQVTGFVRLGFPSSYILQFLLFLGLMVIYVVTATGNLLIISLSWIDRRLHSQMYFFLQNLSFLELLHVSVVIILTGDHTISFASCIIQSYLYFLLGTTDFFLLAVMSLDRYLAICRPLHYKTLMSGRVCSQLVLASWLSGFLWVLCPTILMASQTFCGPNCIDLFFCDSWPLLRLCCGDTHLLEVVAFVLSTSVLLGSLAVTSVSYVCILVTVLRAPTATEQRKAFSTCASHLTVVIIVYGSSIFLYIHMSEAQSMLLNKGASVLSCIITPLLNPFIFSLCNDKVKQALRVALWWHGPTAVGGYEGHKEKKMLGWEIKIYLNLKFKSLRQHPTLFSDNKRSVFMNIQDEVSLYFPPYNLPYASTSPQRRLIQLVKFHSPG